MDATPFVPETRSLKTLREAAAVCRGCPLYGPASQTVFMKSPGGTSPRSGWFQRTSASTS